MIVVLCRDLETRGCGLDLERISSGLQERFSNLDIRISENSCGHSERWLSPDLRNNGPVVLGLCSNELPLQEMRAYARKNGFDPCGVESVALGNCCSKSLSRENATAQALVLLSSVVARLQAGSGSRPENAKMIVAWEGEVSRRSLFTLPPVRYDVVPFILDDVCAVGRGCQICADLCPHQALQPIHLDRMDLLKDKCTGCGACVTVCPREAFHFPASSSAQIGAQVEAMLDGTQASFPRGVLFTCHNSAGRFDELHRDGDSSTQGWFPVEVPCLGMVTSTWILQSLRLGASAVGLLACPENECRFGGREEMIGRVDYCRTILEEMQLPSQAVQFIHFEDRKRLAESLSVLGGLEMTESVDLDSAPVSFSILGAVDAIRGLSGSNVEASELELSHAHSPLGMVMVGDGCTLCGACVTACPSEALAMEEEENTTLTFRAASCVACGGCEPVCSENVVRVDRATRLSALAEERHVLFQDSSPRCVSCGEPIMPQAMLDRLKKSLKDHPSFEIISKYCMECRKTLS
jgi:ferredoxin